MKIQCVSDLHLEWGTDIEIPNAGADVLVLGGDICSAGHPSARITDFFKRCTDDFKHVVYLAGNHEYYHSSIEAAPESLRETIGNAPVHFLQDNSVEIEGVPFFGGTLWTDCNKDNPLTTLALSQAICDYRLIWLDTLKRKLRPADTIAYHKETRHKLGEFLRKNQGHKIVVCTHHSPSFRAVHPRYKTDFHINGGFHSNLDWIMEKNSNIALWTFGHTHTSWDFTINQTQVFCNPAGYPQGRTARENTEFDPTIVLEI